MEFFKSVFVKVWIFLLVFDFTKNHNIYYFYSQFQWKTDKNIENFYAIVYLNNNYIFLNSSENSSNKHYTINKWFFAQHRSWLFEKIVSTIFRWEKFTNNQKVRAECWIASIRVKWMCSNETSLTLNDDDDDDDCDAKHTTDAFGDRAVHHSKWCVYIHGVPCQHPPCLLYICASILVSRQMEECRYKR